MINGRPAYWPHSSAEAREAWFEKQDRINASLTDMRRSVQARRQAALDAETAERELMLECMTDV
jgi:hypothetical protein